MKKIDFLDRMYQEYNQLDERIIKLEKALKTKPLDRREIELLINQKEHMKAYREVLNKRINYTNDILDRKYIYNEEIYCIRQLYEGYALLGGNCTIEERVKEVIKLPAKAGQFNPNKQMIDKAIEEIKKIIQNNKGE